MEKYLTANPNNEVYILLKDEISRDPLYTEGLMRSVSILISI